MGIEYPQFSLLCDLAVFFGMCYAAIMKHDVQKPRGRPPIAGEPMEQIAIRLPREVMDEIEKIIAARHGEADRTAVIRELLREAIAARSNKRRRS